MVRPPKERSSIGGRLACRHAIGYNTNVTPHSTSNRPQYGEPTRVLPVSGQERTLQLAYPLPTNASVRITTAESLQLPWRTQLALFGGVAGVLGIIALLFCWRPAPLARILTPDASPSPIVARSSAVTLIARYTPRPAFAPVAEGRASAMPFGLPEGVRPGIPVAPAVPLASEASAPRLNY